MKFFLKLKAWQVFCLMILPVIPWLFVMDEQPGIMVHFTFILSVCAITGWFYSIGTESNNRLSKIYKRNTIIYKLSFSISILYAVLLAVNFLVNQGNDQNWMPYLHTLSMVGMFYGLWFTAKQYSTLLKNDELFIFDYAGNLFLFWFFFVGVWLLQPEINNVLGDKA